MCIYIYIYLYIYKYVSSSPNEVGCARPLLQAKETELLVAEIDGKKLNLSEQQRKVIFSVNMSMRHDECVWRASR